MTEFQKELIGGIEEIAIEKGMDVKDCIRQALEVLEKQSYENRLHNSMFRGW